MTEQTGKAELYAKLARVMGQIGELEKKGRNASFNYDFIRDVDVVNALRPLLAAEGLALLVGMEHVEQAEIRSGSGSTGYHTMARMNITFADGETGASVTVPWFGEANDYQDKGVNKAATAGVKYALLKTFLIGSEDDPDGATPSASRSAPAQRSSSGEGPADVDLSTTVSFGKHEGKTLGYILENDASYIEWLAENWKWEKGRAMAQALLPKLQNGGGNGASDNGGAPQPTGNGTYNATDFWTLAKQMINNGRDFTAEDANLIKDQHQGPEGVNWSAAYDELNSWTPE